MDMTGGSQTRTHLLSKWAVSPEAHGEGWGSQDHSPDLGAPVYLVTTLSPQVPGGINTCPPTLQTYVCGCSVARSYTTLQPYGL